VAAAPLPNPDKGGGLSTIAQIASQVSAPTQQTSGVARAAPARGSVRPEASAGLDGWLVDRLFGR
jgi:penicillin-binding protein 1A